MTRVKTAEITLNATLLPLLELNDTSYVSTACKLRDEAQTKHVFDKIDKWQDIEPLNNIYAFEDNGNDYR